MFYISAKWDNFLPGGRGGDRWERAEIEKQQDGHNKVGKGTCILFLYKKSM
jgi:hypothetical protein